MSYTFGDAIVSDWNDNAARGAIELRYQTIQTGKVGSLPPAAKTVGQVTFAGESPVPITDFDAHVIQPVDAASGVASGKRVHKPVTITRALDSLGPTLVSAAESNKSYATVVVELQRTGGDGKPETYAKYTFGNVGLSVLEDYGASGEGLSQQVRLDYQSLEVQSGANVAADQWRGGGA
jgi:type VI secretion system secreted protein Hcp